MTAEPMPEPEGPEDERFVYVVTAAGVEALREGAVEFDSERETAPTPIDGRRLDTTAWGARD
jgi:hypothetical protein